MSRTPSRLAAGLAIAAAVVVLFAVSASAQEPGSSSLVYSLKTGKFENRLIRNCDLFFNQGSSTLDSTAAGIGPAVGTFNLAQRSGEVYIKQRTAAWQVQRLPDPGGRGAKRSTAFTHLGIALRGSTVFLTSRITKRGPDLLSASRRVKLAGMRRAKIKTGPLLDGRDRPVPNTFTLVASGKLKMRAAMSRALERQRCKNRRQNRLSRRFKRGYTIGRFTVGVRPGSAMGLAGDATISVFADTDNGYEVTVEATGGNTRNSDGDIAAPLAAGAGVPLTCTAGLDCTPSGGRHGVGGGFDLVFGGRRTSVANLAVSISGNQQTITGTLDGSPVTVAVGQLGFRAPFTSDFNQRAGAALGVGIGGGIAIDTSFTRTGPAG